MARGKVKSTVQNGQAWNVMLLAVLTAAVLASALAVVHTKHESRQLFSELQTLLKDHDKLVVAWDRLRLEEGTFATHGRIETTARERIGMITPVPQNVVYVKP